MVCIGAYPAYPIRIGFGAIVISYCTSVDNYPGYRISLFRKVLGFPTGNMRGDSLVPGDL